MSDARTLSTAGKMASVVLKARTQWVLTLITMEAKVVPPADTAPRIALGMLAICTELVFLDDVVPAKQDYRGRRISEAGFDWPTVSSQYRRQRADSVVSVIASRGGGENVRAGQPVLLVEAAGEQWPSFNARRSSRR
jgi:hypothetical protein